MDIDFIKWMCEKAEGFEYKESYNDISHIPSSMAANIGSRDFKELLKPLLLQRAIEGVNKADLQFYIITNHQYITVVDWSEYEEQLKINLRGREYTHDQAKESALKYIYEQELK